MKKRLLSLVTLVVSLVAAASPEPAVNDRATQEPLADLTSCAKPEYAHNSMRNEEEGMSTLEYLIAADGTVLDGKVVRTSGSHALDQAALDALRKCKFRPAYTNGTAGQAWATVGYV